VCVCDHQIIEADTEHPMICLHLQLRQRCPLSAICMLRPALTGAKISQMHLSHSWVGTAQVTRLRCAAAVLCVHTAFLAFRITATTAAFASDLSVHTGMSTACRPPARICTQQRLTAWCTRSNGRDTHHTSDAQTVTPPQSRRSRSGPLRRAI
jgi:hypothetical protein